MSDDRGCIVYEATEEQTNNAMTMAMGLPMLLPALRKRAEEEMPFLAEWFEILEKNGIDEERICDLLSEASQASEIRITFDGVAKLRFIQEANSGNQ